MLVTCRYVRKIKEFTTDRQLLREVVLVLSVASPWHTVQPSSDKFIVCHSQHVCLIGSDGQVVQSYGGSKGSEREVRQKHRHMVVDRDQFVFVVGRNNCSVLLLSPTLTYIREVL